MTRLNRVFLDLVDIHHCSTKFQVLCKVRAVNTDKDRDRLSHFHKQYQIYRKAVTKTSGTNQIMLVNVFIPPSSSSLSGSSTNLEHILDNLILVHPNFLKSTNSSNSSGSDHIAIIIELQLSLNFAKAKRNEFTTRGHDSYYLTTE